MFNENGICSSSFRAFAPAIYTGTQHTSCVFIPFFFGTQANDRSSDVDGPDWVALRRLIRAFVLRVHVVPVDPLQSRLLYSEIHAL